MSEPTYDDLKAQREKEWAAAQAEAGRRLREQQAQLAQMPDVAHPPNPDAPYSHPLIACPCGGRDFAIRSWVTVNGTRHRTQLECLACHRFATWDWPLLAWCPGA